MAQAKREGGLYYTPQGVAVAADGSKIEGAPKQAPDTDPSKQPGAAGGAPPGGVMTMRLDDDSLRALGGKVPAKAAGAKEAPAASDDDDSLPPVKDLKDHVAGLKTVAEVKAMAKRDDRVSAEPIYEARIAELEEK